MARVYGLEGLGFGEESNEWLHEAYVLHVECCVI